MRQLGSPNMNTDTPIEAAAPVEEPVTTAALVQPTAPPFAVLLNHASLVLSFIGIFVASVLSLGHFFAKSVPCGDNGGCDTVASNPASMVFGFPVAYLGLGAYVVLAGITAMRAFMGLGRTKGIGNIALAISGIGALYSFYLQYLSFTQIHAVCLWCLASAITMCLLFLAQAAIAQMEIPNGARRSGDGGVIFTVGLSLVALLALGYEGTTFVHNAPDLTSSGVGTGDRLTKLLLTPDSMKLGPDDAPVKIIEFSDLLCPSCRAIYPDVKSLVEKSNGKIQLTLRHRPLTKNPEHQMALPAAFLAEYGAESGKGWDFVDDMYAHDISELQTLDAVMTIAKEAGIDTTAAKKRMLDTDPDWQRVLRDLDTAIQLDITETPTFVILAKGVPPTTALGRELIKTINQPQYQSLINEE